MPIDTPLILGPFCVEADGTLRPREEDRPARFGFRWRSHVFAARLEEESLVLEARAGRLPSSAEGAAAIRRDFFESLPALRRLVPEPWRLGLTPAHSLALSARFALALPPRGSARCSPSSPGKSSASPPISNSSKGRAWCRRRGAAGSASDRDR